MKNPNIERYPLGFWSMIDGGIAPVNHPDEWKELGMTLTLGNIYYPDKTDKEHFRKQLDCAYKNGIKVILSDHRAAARRLHEVDEAGYRKLLQSVLDDWGDHPAVWGLHIGDEPEINDYDVFVKAINIFKEMAPQWEPYANLIPWYAGVEKRLGIESYPEYVKKFITDTGMHFISYDCYAQMNPGKSGWETYYKNLKIYSDVSHELGVPFWTILLSIPHFNYRNPSLDDYRWQFNTALASGALGLSWYFIYQQQCWSCNYRNAPVNQLGRKTQGFYDIMDIQNIFWRTIGPKIEKMTLKKVSHVGTAYGGFEKFCGDDEVAPLPDDAPDMIISQFEPDVPDGWKYIMVVNNSCENNVNFSLPLRGNKIEADELLYDDNWRHIAASLHDDGVVKDENGVYSMPHWYAPGQAVFYRYKR